MVKKQKKNLKSMTLKIGALMSHNLMAVKKPSTLAMSKERKSQRKLTLPKSNKMKMISNQSNRP